MQLRAARRGKITARRKEKETCLLKHMAKQDRSKLISVTLLRLKEHKGEYAAWLVFKQREGEAQTTDRRERRWQGDSLHRIQTRKTPSVPSINAFIGDRNMS